MYKSRMHICFMVLKQNKIAAAVFGLFKLGEGFLLPFTAYAFQSLIDGIIFSFQMTDTRPGLFFPFLMVAGIYVFQAVEEPVESYCDFLMRQRVNYYFHKTNMNKIARMEYFHLENHECMNLINRVGESAGDAAVDLYTNILELVSGVLGIAGTFFLLLNYDYLIAVCVIFVSVPIMVLAVKYGKEIHHWYEKNSKHRRQVHYLSSIFTQKAAYLEMREYDHYGYLHEKWQKQSEYLRMQDFKLQIKAWRNAVVSGFLLNFFEYAVYMVMLLPAIGGTITIGAFVGLSRAIGSIESLILWKFSGLFTFLGNSLAYWHDYNAFMAFSEVDEKGESISSMPASKGVSVEFRDVHFKYENMETEVLSGVSFVICPNEMVGLVGLNGAGKSTLSKLMIGLYKPDSGDIFIDGRNTRDMSFCEQARYFGMTYQDFERYHISVLDNIGLPAQNIDSDRAKEILLSLGFEYTELPAGVDTLAGRIFGDGIEFSGGEWQKIALARMLYSAAPFYIMDEPTASLDPMSEVELYKRIQSALSGKSSLLITHRLGATVLCDRILVLANGKIAESGSFSQLMQRRGIYAEMYNKQKQWYER